MVTLCTASAIESTVSVFPTTIVQKVTLHIEKIKANFDDTLNFLNYATMSLSSTNNDTYTFKEHLR